MRQSAIFNVKNSWICIENKAKRYKIPCVWLVSCLTTDILLLVGDLEVTLDPSRPK